MARLIRVVLVALGLWTPALALAATRLEAPAQDTIAAFAEALDVLMRETPLAGTPPETLALARERLWRVRRASGWAPAVEAWSLSRARGSAEASAAVAVRKDWLRDDLNALLKFYAFGPETILASLPDRELADSIEFRIDRVRHAITAFAQLRGLERLRRYEVKYGPGSPRLNFAEVVLNAGLQRIGWFAPGRDGPSPYEGLLAYSTSYLTLDEDRDAHAVSVLEAGFRRYLFSWRPERDTGWLGLLKPRYLSFGVAVAEARDGGLRWPLDGGISKHTRAGPFLTWGDLKLAMLLGPDARFLVSRQVHLLPNLF